MAKVANAFERQEQAALARQRNVQQFLGGSIPNMWAVEPFPVHAPRKLGDFLGATFIRGDMFIRQRAKMHALGQIDALRTAMLEPLRRKPDVVTTDMQYHGSNAEALNRFALLCMRFFKDRIRKFDQHYSEEHTVGWRKLGSGNFGEAWVHCEFPDHVLKISGYSSWGRGSSHNAGKDGWKKYIQWCMRRDEQHLPKAHLYHQEGEFAFAIMPRYMGVGEGEFRTSICRDPEYATVSNMMSRWDQLPVHGAVAPSKYMLDLVEFKDSNRLSGDMHSGNVMICPRENTWVLTDPFF